MKPYKCFDCGSTIVRHHTKSCELAPKRALRDLPVQPGTQWWTGEVPESAQPVQKNSLWDLKQQGKYALAKEVINRYKKRTGGFVPNGEQAETMIGGYFRGTKLIRIWMD